MKSKGELQTHVRAKAGEWQKWLVGHTKGAVGGRRGTMPREEADEACCSMETGTGRDGCPFSPITAHLLAAHTELQRLG